MQISTLNGHNKSFETCKLWEWKLADKTLLLRTQKEKSFQDQMPQIKRTISLDLLCSHGLKFYTLQKEYRIFIPHQNQGQHEQHRLLIQKNLIFFHYLFYRIFKKNLEILEHAKLVCESTFSPCMIYKALASSERLKKSFYFIMFSSLY